MTDNTWTQRAGMTSDTETSNIETYAEQAEASKDAAAASETAAAGSASSASTSSATATTKAAESASSATQSASSATASAASAAASAVSAATAATAQAAAETAETNAETAKTAAETAKTAAETAETNAETAEVNAETAETNSASSAAAASASATAASGSAGSASTQASNASDSATASEASRVAAVAAKTAAETAKTNAETAETNAETAETNAATSETNAATSASTATTKAQLATDKSVSATQSANVASTHATSATSSASTATTQAGNASTSATASEASRVAAVAAQAAAETAETNAETAQAAAEAAETNAAASETAASASETNAATSAATSTTKAGEAASSATAAAASEAAASSSQSSATSSAATATTQASNASTSATQSAGSAIAAAAAQTAAETAETNAETAKTNAETAETNAAASETAASTSETNAATSAATATTQAGVATTKSGEASASATSAASSASSASASKDAALAALDSFDDRYLGQKASNPTTDNDGDALVSGALYFNTTTDSMMVYEGSSWVAAYASLSGALLAASNLSDVADAAASRTSLGLVIGTNVQAFSAVLAATTASYTTAEETKLAGIEAAADVTDTANVVNALTAGANITIAANGTISGAAQYTHPTHAGDDFSVDTGALTGATVVSDIDINVATDTLGHVTDANGSVATRTLTLADLGYTGATNATANVGDITAVNAGGGLTGGGSSGAVILSHEDTSSQGSVNNSGRTYIQDITLDTYGHVTGLATATETVVNTDTVPHNATITLSAGGAITGGGSFTTDQSSAATITFNHADTSSQSSVNNSGRTYIQDIALDTYGHITSITSATETVTDSNTNRLTTFVVEDGDGTEVTISQGKEWKFVEGGGIDINWTDTSTGSDGDPYDLTISHVDTSSQASVDNTGATVIQDVTLDTYGHVTALGSHTLTLANLGYTGATDANNYSFPYTVSASAGNNTVVQRNGSGYIFSNYFNGTGTFSTSGGTSGMGLFTGTNGSDTYGRSYTAAAARALLNVANGATNYTANQAVNTSSAPTFVDVYVHDQILHSGDTNTYMQFHNLDQWRVVVGGSERLEVKNSSPHVLVTGDLNSTSDERLKDNIEPIENALSDVCKLEGVSFNWKDTGTKATGFIAQQVEPILPDLVNTNEDDGIKSVNYIGLIGHLVEAIKEQQAQIDALTAKLNS
jgi:hypothetical protein